MSAELPAEVALAFACCSWPIKADGSNRDRVRAAADHVGDWDRFDRVIRRNRVSSLASRALNRAGVELPEPMRQALSRRALANARTSLAMARESLCLQRAFEQAGLPVMIIKGAPLALLAYGELGVKESWDIDLLTSRTSVADAARVLAELGYRNRLGPLDKRQLEAYARVSKEAEFTHPATGITVELHWGLIDNRHLLRGIDVEAAAQDVSTPAGTLRTLADEELFAYLCAHGAVHNWSRMKWLADLGALLAGRSEADVERLFAAARRYGVGRSASVALALCRRFLGRNFSARLIGSLEQGAIVSGLQRNVLAGLAYRAGAVEHTPYSPPWLRTIAAQFVVEPGPSHALEYWRQVWNLPLDRLEMPLPEKLAFLYPLLRIPLWLRRSARRMTGTGDQGTASAAGAE